MNELWTLPGELALNTPYDSATHANLDVEDVNAGLTDFHTLQVQDFADAVRTGRPPAVTGRDARTSLAVIEAVYESARTGRPVAPAPALVSTTEENR